MVSSLFFITPINILFLIARRFRCCEDLFFLFLFSFFFPENILSLQLLKLASVHTLVPETMFDKLLSTDVVCFNCLIFQLTNKNLNRRTVF